MQNALEISLRPISIVDFDVMCKIELDSRNLNYTTLEMPDVNDIRAFLLAGQDIRRDCQIRYSIDYQSKVIGFVDLSDVVFEKGISGVGVFILKEFRKAGFAKQALKCLGDIALELGLNTLYAEARKSNLESRKLFLSAGYIEKDSNELYRRFEYIFSTEAN